MAIPNVLSIVGILLWVGYEVLLRRRKDAETGSWHGDAADQGSTRFLIAAYIASVAITVLLTSHSVGRVSVGWRWIGVALIVAGLVLRAWGMQTLGRYYTRTLRTVDEQRIVQEGPYAVIRHPGYCGSLLVWMGYALGLGSWLALVVVAVLLLTAYTWRINAEERMLASSFGPEYTAYQGRTKRLVPFVY